MEKSKTMEKDDVLRTAVLDFFFMPSEHRPGFGGGVYELFSPQFPSCTSISAKSLSRFLPWLPLLPIKDRIAT